MASGTGCCRSPSQRCIVAISSCWALMMRSARMRTELLAPCDGAQRDITIAWAWCPIIADMKWTSAAVYGYRRLSARARAIAAGLLADTVAGIGAVPFD